MIGTNLGRALGYPVRLVEGSCSCRSSRNLPTPKTDMDSGWRRRVDSTEEVVGSCPIAEVG
jgi:hypothetical protein